MIKKIIPLLMITVISGCTVRYKKTVEYPFADNFFKIENTNICFATSNPSSEVIEVYRQRVTCDYINDKYTIQTIPTESKEKILIEGLVNKDGNPNNFSVYYFINDKKCYSYFNYEEAMKGNKKNETYCESYI